MSLLRTLAKVAVGVAVARGARALVNRGDREERRSGGNGLLDSLRGQEFGGAGGIGQLLGGRGSSGGAGGGLGGLLEEFGGSGALGGLGGMLGGGAAGGLLGGLLGGNGNTDRQPAFGRRLNESLRTGGEPADPPTDDEEAMAALMIRAMIMAAKSDGRIDRTERDALLGQLDDLDPEERAFVTEEMERNTDPREFARDVPDHPALRAQIFATAMSAIEVDSPRERQFAEDLAEALGVESSARSHVQRRMSGEYGAHSDDPWEKSANTRAYSQPIQAPASAGAPSNGAKGQQGNAGLGRPYRK